MPPEITRLTTQFLKDPTRIEASRPAMTAETIAQHLVPVPSSDPKAKRLALRTLVERADVKNGIVFCNRKSEVDIVAKSLKRHGHDAAAIHGDLDQSVRTRTLNSFRNGELKLLVASDVAARGLDIPDVSHVFNYDVPHHADDYVHRIGRTGRAGRSGETFMIVTPADDRSLDKVLKLIKMSPDEVALDLDWGAAASGGAGARRGRAEPARKPARAKAPPAEAAAAPTAAAAEAEPKARRSRGSRSRKPQTETQDTAVEAAASPAPAAPGPAEAEAEAPRRSRSRRGQPRRDDAPRNSDAPRPAPVEREPETGTGRGRERDARHREPRKPGGPATAASGSTSFGSGADVPAFLRRPPR